MASTGETSSQLALRDPDIRLMLQVREDVPGAFERLVEQYQHRLVVIMNHLVGNPEEAEDLAQEVFFRVYRARKSYRPRSKFATWLFTIANNLALNSLRSRQRKPTLPLRTQDSSSQGIPGWNQAIPDPRSGPMQKIQRQELSVVIRQAIDNLNERQKMAVVLNKFEDMGYAEIAEVMNLNVKAVKSLLSRARINLKEALAAYIYPEGKPTLPRENLENESFQDRK